MMDPKDYILKYHRNLLLSEEKAEFSKFDEYLNFWYLVRQMNLDLNSLPEEFTRHYSHINIDEAHLYTIEKLQELRCVYVENILRRNPSLQEQFHKCPVCKALCRTPVARQCPNGHRW